MSAFAASHSSQHPAFNAENHGSEDVRLALQRLNNAACNAVLRSGMAMMVTDPHLADNPIVFVNDACLRLTGYTAEQLLGRNCRLLQGPRTDPDSSRRIAAAVRSGISADAEILNYRSDGTPFLNRLCITPLAGADGSVAFFMATVAEIVSESVASATPAQIAPAADATNERLQAALAGSGLAAAFEWEIAAERIVGDARFAALYGIDPAEALSGISPARFVSQIHPSDRTRMRLAIGGMLRGAELLSREFRLTLPNGKVRWMHARARCLYDADDRPVSFSGALVDIAEQKRVQEQLRVAQTAGGIGTFEYTDGFATVSVSQQFCQLLGLHPSAELPVRTVNNVVLPGDPPLLDPNGARAGGTMGAEIETRIRRPSDGEIRWLARRGEQVDGRPDDETNQPDRFCGVIYDITTAKLVEKQLRFLNETLELRVAESTRERDVVWRTSQDLFVLCDLSGTIRSVNPAWTASLGFRIEDIVGTPFEALVHPDDLPLARAQFAACLNEHRHPIDLRLRAADGGWRRYSWQYSRDNDAFYAAGRDVTERFQLEEQLRQSQKMEAVGQLTGGIAHDFNNLLTGIAGSLELLGTRVAQGRFKDVERYINAAQGAARRAASLTHRLLAFSRRQTLDPKPTDINALLQGLEELVRRTVGPQVAVHTVLAADPWTTMVDPNQLENAVLNLCINARDAMPDGGSITVETANVALDDSAAREHDIPPGHYVSLSVSDTGTGMTPDVIARAFDPFFTTKPIGEGTGLGLSMIYGFMRQSGGQVRIQSEPGRGTVMRLYLPRHLGDDGVDDGAVPDTEGDLRATIGQTVLIVDDEPTVRMLVTEVLEDLGYVAIEAADGSAGLQVLQSDARVDLLVTDVGLPGGLNGRQVADAGRVARPELKVLFITGYAETAVVGNGQLEAGMHVLTKPFAMETLAGRIKTLMDS